MPDFESLIQGLAGYCAGFAKVSKTSPSAIAAYEASHTISGATVDPTNPQTIIYKLTSPASYFTSMLTLAAFSPVPEGGRPVPAGQRPAGHAHNLRRPVQGHQLHRDAIDHVRP